MLGEDKTRSRRASLLHPPSTLGKEGLSATTNRTRLLGLGGLNNGRCFDWHKGRNLPFHAGCISARRMEGSFKEAVPRNVLIFGEPAWPSSKALGW